jgi:hypothetical protein
MKIRIKPLDIKAERIDGVLGKIKGLMFSKRKNVLFVFGREQKIGIHMLFVFFKIIVIWLDPKKRITKIKVMRPFVSVSEARGKYVLETPYSEKLFLKIRKCKRLGFKF